MKEYLVYDSGKQKTVCAGVVENDTFIKSVNFQKHFIRICGGYAIQKEVLRKLKEDGINAIRIDEGENIYSTSVESYYKHGKEFNLGYGEQIGLDVKYMRKSDQKQEMLF
jgi:hypothetical protein